MEMRPARRGAWSDRGGFGCGLPGSPNGIRTRVATLRGRHLDALTSPEICVRRRYQGLRVGWSRTAVELMSRSPPRDAGYRLILFPKLFPMTIVPSGSSGSASTVVCSWAPDRIRDRDLGNRMVPQHEVPLSCRRRVTPPVGGDLRPAREIRNSRMKRVDQSVRSERHRSCPLEWCKS